MSTGKEVREPVCGHEGAIFSVAVNKNCRIIASASDDDTVRVWTVSEEKSVEAVLHRHTSLVSCVALDSNSSKVVSGSWHGTVRTCNIPNAKEVVCAVEEKEGRRISALCRSLDRKVVVCGCNDGGISIWDTETGRTKEIGVRVYKKRSRIGCNERRQPIYSQWVLGLCGPNIECND